MKQKDFIINLIFLIVLNLLIKPFWILGIDLQVQNRVGAENYGLYFSIFSFTYLFNTLLDMGITNFNNRNIARYSHLLSKYFAGFFSLKIFLGILYLILAFAVALLIGYDTVHFKLLIFIAVNQVLNSLILFVRSNVSALMMFKTDSFLSILDRLLMILLCGLLLCGNIIDKPFQIEWFIYTQTFAYLLALTISLFILLPKAKPQKLHWNFPFLLVILKKSFPFALLCFLMSCYNRFDSVMLERFLPKNGAFEAGIYASAFRLLDALVMIAYLFSVILLPLFSKMLKEKENIKPILRISFSLILLFSVSTTLILVIFRIPILQLLYTDHVQESAEVFRFLIPCIVPISFTYIFGTLLTANGNMKSLNIISLVGIFVNVIINILLIPRFQAVGAAIASLTTQSVVALAQIWIVRKELKNTT